MQFFLFLFLQECYAKCVPLEGKEKQNIPEKNLFRLCVQCKFISVCVFILSNIYLRYFLYGNC